MNEILTDYTINQQTIALLPSKQIEFETIVLEQDKKLLVRKSAIEIITDSCLQYYSTYDGRRKAVMYHTGFKRKVPIPISISKDIYTFPTHSTTDYECMWISYNHIGSITNTPQSKKLETHSIITFKSHQQLVVNVSNYILEKQIERTAMCKFRFSDSGMMVY